MRAFVGNPEFFEYLQVDFLEEWLMDLLGTSSD
jgi:hypothetical protein